MTRFFLAGVLLFPWANVEAVEGADPSAGVQVAPLPDQECAFEIGGVEVVRYHYGQGAPKPYLFPLRGPAGASLTGMTHPHDPVGHRHHRSVWVGHRDVNGENFWEETGGTRVVTDGLEQVANGPDSASATFRHRWLGAAGEVLLEERRTLTLWKGLAGEERYLDITLALSPAGKAVTLGRTPFGFLGVRVAATMAVQERQGEIRNAEGGRNEAGVYGRRSRWVDYSGPVGSGTHNGVALFDHPANPRFPTYFHVRDDGWMGASFCYDAPYELAPGRCLVLRYRLYLHGPATPATIQRHWESFAKSYRCTQANQTQH